MELGAANSTPCWPTGDAFTNIALHTLEKIHSGLRGHADRVYEASTDRSSQRTARGRLPLSRPRDLARSVCCGTRFNNMSACLRSGPVRIERSPLTKLLGVRQRLPDLRGRVPQFAHENERPLLSIFSDLRAKSVMRRIRLATTHLFFLPFTEDSFSILSRCFSRASMCLDQSRRNGANHASSSWSGLGLRR